MTEIVGKAIEKRLIFISVSDEQAKFSQSKSGASEKMINARLEIFKAIREGILNEVTDVVKQVTGKAPLSFDVWVNQNKGAFK